MLTIKEVATELKVHYKTVEKWVREDKIKAVNVGRHLRISEEELERIKQNGVNND